MSSRSMVLLFSSFAISSALHAHGRQHQHAPRQDGTFSILPFSEPIPLSSGLGTAIASFAPIETGITPPQSISEIATELDNCLTEIPLDVINLMNAIDQRLQQVQSQISDILNPQPTLPTFVPPPYSVGVPTGVPSVSAPGVELPLPSTFALPSSISVPAVSPPGLPTTPPSVSLPASLSVPSDVSSCFPAHGAGPLVPCSLPMSTLTTHVLTTQTINISVTTHVPLPTGLSASGLLSGITRSPSLSVLSLSVPSLSLASPSLPSLSPSLPSAPSVGVPSGLSVSSPSLLPSGLSVLQPSLPTGLSVSAPGLTSISVVTAIPSINPVFAPSVPTTLSVVGIATPSLPPALVTPPSAPVLGSIGVSTPLPSFPRTMNLTTITDLASSKLVSIPTTSAAPFIADARDNVAAYFGNSPGTRSGGLSQICDSSSVNIVILSFVYDFFSQGGYPSAWFGQGSCDTQTPAQVQKAPGLSSCAPLAQQIAQCQNQNKKVFVSLGGYIANSSFSSDQEAERLAVNLWNLFGSGTGDDSTLRPFGNVIVDGFDIDNEDGSQAHWDTFVSAMRALFASDGSKQYYLSAAPQCPYPDASNSISTLRQLDFVWVQFYNNPSCNLDSPGFQLSFRQWSNELQGGSSMSVSRTGPQFYVGIPAFSAAGSGYVNPSALTSYFSLAKELWVANQGGIMLWDGSEALQNTDQFGNNYLDYAKEALHN